MVSQWNCFLILCIAGGVWSTVAPSCTWDGRHFNSQFNILDISSTCAVQFGTASGFSMAFTLEVSSFSNQGIIDFGTSIGAGGVRVTALSAGHLQWSIFDDGGTAFHVSSGPVSVNVKHRWLMTIDSTGHMEIYKDGVKDGDGNSGKSMTTVSRTLMVGGLLDNSTIFREGRTEDLFLFNQVVDWASAVVPVPSAVCTWEGQVFNGSENQLAYPTGCPSWPGGSLSVALTVRLDAWGAINTLIFDFEGGGYKQDGMLLQALGRQLKLSFTTWTLLRGAGNEIAATTQPLTTAVTKRYLLVAASSGYVQMWVDGELLSEGYKTPFVPSDSQTFAIGGPKNRAGERFSGLVEDFFVFYDKVGWDSAVVPPGTPDCSYAGAEFHGTSNFDLATICTSTFGGSLSFAFRARVDSTGADQAILGFMPVDGVGNPLTGERVILAYVYADGRIACWHGEFGVGTSTSVVGLTQRYLCTFSSTGFMQMFIDGTLVQEAQGVGINSATRAMKLASTHDSNLYFDGLVEDLYIFHSKVGWNSATTSSTTTSTATTSWTSTLTTSSATTASTTTSTATATTTTSRTQTITSSTSSTASTTTTSSTSATATSTSSTTATTSTVSTVTSTTTRSEDGVIEFLDEVYESFSSVAVRLAGSTQTAITESLFGGILQLVKLGSLYPPAAVDPNPWQVVLDIPEANVSIRIPLSFLDLQPPNVSRENVLVAVGIVDPSSEESGLRRWASKPHPDGMSMTVEAVMVLEFLELDGTRLDVRFLPEPIEYTMQAKYSDSGAGRSDCAFWDEDLQQWSYQGVRESPLNEVGENLKCLTEHLSLFGALLRGFLSAITCSQMKLLNSEGIENLVHGDWHMETGAVLYWWTVAASLLLCVIAVVIDQWRARCGQTWSSESFLFVVAQETSVKKVESDEDASEGSGEEPKQGFICWAVCCCLGGIATVCSCLKETAVRDGLDEIMTEWCSHFAEVHACIEGCWEGLEIGALSAGRIFQLSHSAMCQVTLSSARRLGGASLFLSDEVVSFVLGDEDLQDLLMTKYAPKSNSPFALGEAKQQATSANSTVSGGIPDSARTEPGARWWTCPHHEEAWFLLHREVTDAVEKQINHHNFRNLPQIVLRIFLSHNPIGLVFCHDIFFNCKLRSFFHALELHGSLMVTAVFFAASGGRRGRKGRGQTDAADCDATEPELMFIVGKALAVAFGSVLLSGVPVTFLQSLHTRSFKSFDAVRSPPGSAAWRRQLNAWFFQDVLIWTLGSLYLCGCAFFVCLFLANVSNKDHREFARTAILCIIQNIVVIPLVVALFVPTTAGILLYVNGRASGRESLLRDIHCRLYTKTNVMLPLVTV